MVNGQWSANLLSSRTASAVRELLLAGWRESVRTYQYTTTRVRYGIQALGKLLADAEFLNDGLVSLGVVLLQVIQQATALADHDEEPAPGRVVLLVGLEMVGQLADPLTEDRDLDLGGPSIGCMRPELANDLLLLLSR